MRIKQKNPLLVYAIVKGTLSSYRGKRIDGQLIPSDKPVLISLMNILNIVTETRDENGKAQYNYVMIDGKKYDKTNIKKYVAEYLQSADNVSEGTLMMYVSALRML